jgi:glycosyltransferase involved in cell wall biosynthesis
MIKISVVIPTFRRPQLLKTCLSSLKEQSFPKENFEVIVVSDGPDEIIKAAIEDFYHSDLQFFFLQMPVKKGPAAARNFGWQQAKGILIAFTDDDTLPNPSWLNNIWKAYNEEKEIAFTGAVKVPLNNPPTDYEKNTAGLETAEFVTANCCCTKSALQKTGGFDERFSMAWREDSDLEFQLMLHKIPIVHLPDAVVVHPVRKAPWGISMKEQKKGLFNALLYKKHPQLYRQKIQQVPPWNYYVMVIAFFVLVIAVVFDQQTVVLLSFLCWAILLLVFIAKRLRYTSKAAGHVAEMGRKWL